jgi:hypothetical protein
MSQPGRGSALVSHVVVVVVTVVVVVLVLVVVVVVVTVVVVVVVTSGGVVVVVVVVARVVVVVVVVPVGSDGRTRSSRWPGSRMAPCARFRVMLMDFRSPAHLTVELQVGSVRAPLSGRLRAARLKFLRLGLGVVRFGRVG